MLREAALQKQQWPLMFTGARPSLALCSLDPLLLLLQLLLQGSHGYLALVQTSLRKEQRCLGAVSCEEAMKAGGDSAAPPT